MTFPELWSMPVMSNMTVLWNWTERPRGNTGPHRQSFPVAGWLRFVRPEPLTPSTQATKANLDNWAPAEAEHVDFPVVFPIALDVSMTFALLPTVGLPLTSPHSDFYQIPKEERESRRHQPFSARSVWPSCLTCLTHRQGLLRSIFTEFTFHPPSRFLP